MSQRIFFSALLMLWLASRASADGGDDFANNLASDLGPIIALFGERVVMQFMSQAMGIADCILLAVAPLGAITTVVSAIRVAGPTWLKSFIGRARENLSVAEVEVMSSTSKETCELWNGHRVVRCPGSANIYQFICLIPKKIADEDILSTLATSKLKIRYKTLRDVAEEMDDNDQTSIHQQGAEAITIASLLQKKEKTGSKYVAQFFKDTTKPLLDTLLDTLAYQSLSASLRKAEPKHIAQFLEDKTKSLLDTFLETLKQFKMNLSGRRPRLDTSDVETASVVSTVPHTEVASVVSHIPFKRITDDLRETMEDPREITEDSRKIIEDPKEIAEDPITYIMSSSSHKSPPDPPREEDSPREEGPPREEELEMVIITDNLDDGAPNLLLNCHDRVGRKEIYLAAALGILLQFGAIIYFGFITYHKPIQQKFLKDGKNIVRYAFPCAAIGTMLLVFGLFICSWAVGESTIETFYEAGDHKMFIVWLQKDHTVSDQEFRPYAIYPASKRDYFTISRRKIEPPSNKNGDLCQAFKSLRRLNDQPLYWPLKPITVVGSFISLVGFISQFIGMRGLNWTASIVQLGITIVVTILRVTVRRGLGKAPNRTVLKSKYELDWFVLSFGNLGAAHWIKSNDELDKEMDDTRDKPPSTWEVCTGGEQTYRPLTQLHTDGNPDGNLDSETNSKTNSDKRVKISLPHQIMLARKHLGKYSKWSSPVLEEATSLSGAIEAVANTFLSRQSKETYEWEIPASYIANNSTKPVKDNVYIRLFKDRDDRWRVDKAEIEAILSLWLYSTTSTNHSKTNRPRSLRVYGPTESERRLKRDFEWWMREDIPKIFQRPGKEATKLAYKESDCIIVGFKTEYSGVKRATRTQAQNDFIEDYLALECQDEQQRLFSRELFFSFMRAIAKMPELDIASASSVHPLSSSTMSEGWKQMRLENDVISGLARRLEKTGFGSLSDIYIDLIMPLSLDHKLTDVKNIIDGVSKEAHEYERTLQWEKLVDTCISLMDLALRFDLEKESSSPRAIAICLGFLYRLHHEAKLQESERRTEEELKPQLSRLRKRFIGDNFRISAYFSTILPSKLQFFAVSLSVLAGINTSPISFPSSFQIAAENLKIIKERYSKKKIPISDIKVFKKTDAFGWSLLHYAANLALDIDIHWQMSHKITFPNPRDLMGWTPLHHACFIGNEEMVKVLLKYGTPIEIAEKDGITPMHCAVQSGKAEIIKELMRELDQRQTKRRKPLVDRNERCPIHWAAVEGNVEMVRLMKDSIPQKDRFGWTPLHLAAVYEHKEILKYITTDYAAASLNIDAGDNDFRTPLHLAVEYERIAAVQVLVEADAKVNTVAKDGSAPLHVAVKHKRILRMLLKYGTNLEVMDMEGRTSLYLSVENGEIEAIEMLIKAGANVKAAAKDGRTPLHVSLTREQDGLQVAEMLLEAGADANTTAKDGATVLHIAAQCGSLLKILNFLDRVALNIDTIDEYGQTALLIAIYEREWEAVKRLLDMGASVNAGRRKGYTPLLGAVTWEKEDISRQLLDKGASVNEADGDGYSALHLAISNGNQRIAQALLDSNANIDAVVSGSNDTPLHIAVRKGQTKIIQTLLEQGANTLLLNNLDFSPLQYALYGEDFPMVRILIEHDKKSTIKAALQPNKEGDTPLHTLAACTEYEDTICEILDELLSISSDIDINAKNSEGRTPLDVALFTQTVTHRMLITKLLEVGAKPGSNFTKAYLKDWEEYSLFF